MSNPVKADHTQNNLGNIRHKELILKIWKAIVEGKPYQPGTFFPIIGVRK